MVTESLFSSLKQLDKAEKLRVMQFLLVELAQDEGVSLVPDQDYPIWTPLEAYGAADVMQRMLMQSSEAPKNG
jgi:hypothetical protein